MVKYYISNYTIYKVDDDNKQYAYYKSSDEWRPVIKKLDIENLLWTEDFWEEPNMTDKYLEHCKSLSTL